MMSMSPDVVPPIYQGHSTPPPLHFYLYDDIGEPRNYCELVFTLDTADENSEIHIHLATGGGDMESAIVISHAIMRSRATVVGHADGGVASAGTIILLSCSNFYISPFAHFLFHDGSLGVPRLKFSENLKQANAICDLYAKLAHSIYYPFFTHEEIDKILGGDDLYLSSEQMQYRIDEAIQMFSEQKESVETQSE